jgi:RNA polymerase sigma-70 factor (ECF subfamily)
MSSSRGGRGWRNRSPVAGLPAEIGHFLSTIALRGGQRRYRLIATRANGQPAFGCYYYEPHAPIAHAHGILVLTISGNQITTLTAFLDNSLMPYFGLPRTLRHQRSTG